MSLTLCIIQLQTVDQCTASRQVLKHSIQERTKQKLIIKEASDSKINDDTEDVDNADFALDTSAWFTA